MYIFIINISMFLFLNSVAENIIGAPKIWNDWGSHGIEPKRDWTHFLKIRFVVAGGGFYSYYNLQCIKLDKEKRILEKKSVLCIQKHLTQFLKMGSVPFWDQFHAYRFLINISSLYFVAKRILSGILFLLLYSWSWDHLFSILTKTFQIREWSRVCVCILIVLN